MATKCTKADKALRQADGTGKQGGTPSNKSTEEGSDPEDFSQAAARIVREAMKEG